jgi:hypothetical protein
MSGLETISISATPERLRSTKDMVGMLVVHRLARVLLEMQALDADFDILELARESAPRHDRPRPRSAA